MAEPATGRVNAEAEAERAVPLPVAVVIIVLLVLAVAGGGLAVGYRFFWNKFSGPRVWEAEIQRWQFALKKDPKDVEAWAQLGYAFMQNGQLRQAEQAYNKALQLNPKAVELNYFLGQIKMLEHRPADAERLFRKVAEVAPGNPLPHYALAQALVDQRKFQPALQELNYIVEKIDPALVEVLHLRGVALDGLGRRKEAIESFKQALRFDPSYQPARDALHRLGVKDSELPQMPTEVGRPGTIVPVKPGEPGSVAGFPGSLPFHGQSPAAGSTGGGAGAQAGGADNSGSAKAGSQQ